jgi:bifunctional UDP-N-acetylglucosamine pyrophosphorylase/glucosamine-1-phosphate N-acetyltransferase
MVVILAAGKGTRMKSTQSKVMHKIAHRSMIGHILNTAEQLTPQKIITVIAPYMKDVKEAVAPHFVAIQSEQKGTGHAVLAAMDVIGDFKGDILVLYGDVPLVSLDTLHLLLAHHRQGSADGRNFGATILAFAPPDATGYGRIFQNPDGTLNRIVEEKDATPDEKLVRLSNSGLMVLAGENLRQNLEKISSNNAQGEYYLVDLPKILSTDNIPSGVVRGDYFELRGVNSRAQLADLELAFQYRKRMQLMDQGVTLIDPTSVFFAYDTCVASDVVIEPHVFFGPEVKIESHAVIHAYSYIEGAHIKSQVSVGPFARIRPHSVLEEKAKIGNFVEIKNSHIGQGAKANHLGYIGDAILGAGSNFGCGAITVNYDGQNKHKTIIGDNVMVGSNASLIAPIEIASGAYVAAGSTIDENIAADDLAIARARVVVKKDGAKKFRKDSK